MCVHRNLSYSPSTGTLRSVLLMRRAALLFPALLALALKGDSLPAHRAPVTPARAPVIMLWAWERPEDLRTLSPDIAGVAFLAQRVFLNDGVHSIPRHQPIRVPESIYAVAVTRIEIRPGFRDTEAMRAQTAAAIVQTATLADINGLQIDFDATPAQRAFYTDVLQRVRAATPASMSLTMTALVSWCAESDGWLHTLPVDQAIPMHFRLGVHIGYFATREPLCVASVGLSTDESQEYPATRPRQVYLFSPKPWTEAELGQINQNLLPKAE
ncbi:DUF3142 domain-containing protein [Terriglobus albidus]|uniref:DUF3142 domain-containing protein n=2 Tax=Terriglobus albidus TaxID=1592106 RepID=A0A5B9E3J2_9BACT|nr:DUF3142 domain-containing protein [Terriglobus albidus]